MSLCSERKSVHDNSGPVGEVLEVHPGASQGLKELRLPLLLQPVVQEDGGPGVMGQRKPRRAGLAAMRYEWAAPRGSSPPQPPELARAAAQEDGNSADTELLDLINTQELAPGPVTAVDEGVLALQGRSSSPASPGPCPRPPPRRPRTSERPPVSSQCPGGYCPG